MKKQIAQRLRVLTQPQPGLYSWMMCRCLHMPLSGIRLRFRKDLYCLCRGECFFSPVGSTIYNLTQCVSTAAESHAQTQVRDNLRNNQMNKLISTLGFWDFPDSAPPLRLVGTEQPGS